MKTPASTSHHGDDVQAAASALHKIDERQREVAALRAAEERFRSLFEHSPHCLWEEDLSDVKLRLDELRASGIEDIRAYLEQHPEEVANCVSKFKILNVNQAALRHYAANSKAELVAGLDRILAPESFTVLTQQLIALAEGETLFESDAVDQTLTGKKNHILLKVLVAPGAEATLSNVYVSIVDLTAHRQLEEQLRQSQKMDAIGQLAGGVAHDFNNLLTVIQGNIALLQAADITPEQSAEAFDHIAQTTERAAALTRQLLALSRRQVLQPQSLDMNEVVASLARLLERVLSTEITLVLRLHPQPLLVQADASMLDQVLMNLVVNARDALPNGGRIVIETFLAGSIGGSSNDTLDAPGGLWACVSVADTGSGIPADALPRIFEPFFTTKAPGKGTGLGLSTAFGIVKQHGGSLTVKSALGLGTTFCIRLPAQEGGL
jgi:signal transduction histidine kinase